MERDIHVNDELVDTMDAAPLLMEEEYTSLRVGTELPYKNPFQQELEGISIPEGKESVRFFLEELALHGPDEAIERRPLVEFMESKVEGFKKHYLIQTHRQADQILREHNSKWRINVGLLKNSRRQYYSTWEMDPYEHYTQDLLGDIFGETPTPQQKRFINLLMTGKGTQHAIKSEDVGSYITSEKNRSSNPPKNAHLDTRPTLEESQVKQKETDFGVDAINVICYFMLPKEITKIDPVNDFKMLEGNPAALILGSSLTKDDLTIYRKQLADVEDKVSIDDFFTRSFIGTLNTLWERESVGESRPQERDAWAIIQYLKKEGWTKEQIMTIVGKHFSVEIPEEYHLVPPNKES